MFCNVRLFWQISQFFANFENFANLAQILRDFASKFGSFAKFAFFADFRKLNHFWAILANLITFANLIKHFVQIWDNFWRIS